MIREPIDSGRALAALEKLIVSTAACSWFWMSLSQRDEQRLPSVYDLCFSQAS